MTPQVWGPSLWSFLHNLAISYPNEASEEQIQNHSMFLTILGKIIPCVYCRKGYSEFNEGKNFQKILSSKTNFFKYTVDLHNHVNQKLKKKNNYI